MARQLVQGHLGPAKILLDDLPIVDEDHRLTAEKLPQADAFQRQMGQYQLQPHHRQDRYQAVDQGDGVVLHWDRRQIRYQHGYHEFRRLHLSDLPLAQQPHGQDQSGIQYDGSHIGQDHIPTSGNRVPAPMGNYV